MIAIPLEEENATTISDLFGNAPYFAILNPESGYFKVKENKGCGNGIETAQCIKDLGAKSTVFYHMGEGVFNHLNENGVKVYSSSSVYLTIEEIYRKILKNNFKLVTPSNADNLLNPGTTSCSCECSNN
ncbi:NifB/NifX family molybdenum-iron cluster-binding protein [Arcobacter sp. LA11]|uniref:NifB/NifX family molybdenum-iron cluster-binding protein n=1 Tax=Arcobacter sp. LA11 TaxID=1898176 RepID=UPI0009328343|nr:NifB/NifX family molybdenum-iron cluster-binding protein [Arcobacter sp. LA11]